MTFLGVPWLDMVFYLVQVPKAVKPKLYEKKGCLPPRTRRQQTPNESSSEEDACSWNSSSKEEEDELLSSNRVNPIKTGRRLQFISDSDTE